MRGARFFAMALIASAAFLATAGAARAGPCTGRFRFCDNCVSQISVVTRKNTPCQINYWITNGAIFSQRVTKRGSGIYGTANSTRGAYQPKPNFVGKDAFAVEISYQRGATKFTTTLQADVTVTD
jgi:hypothetical protein